MKKDFIIKGNNEDNLHNFISESDTPNKKIPIILSQEHVSYLVSCVREGGKYRGNLISDLQRHFKLSRGEAEYLVEHALDKGLIIQKPEGDFIAS